MVKLRKINPLKRHYTLAKYVITVTRKKGIAVK